MRHLHYIVAPLLMAAIVGSMPGRLRAESISIEQFKFSGGIVVVLDFDDGKFIADLATDKPFIIHVLLSDEDHVAAARNAIQEAGVYGKVSCDLYNGRDLPYVDGLVNLVLHKESCQVPEAELMRVLVPGGRLVTEVADGWKKEAKPVPDGLDEWNQFLHGPDNNGVSLDDVGPPQRLRWHDTPEFGRSKALSPSFTNMVSADGVLLTIEDRATTEDINAPVDYYLVARDGFNGIELWKRPMKQWSEWQTGSIKSIPTQQQRCLAAVGKTVYVCSGFGGPVMSFSIRTGAPRQVYEHSKGATEFAIDGNVLYVIKGTPYRLPRAEAVDSVAELCAIDLEKGNVVWSHSIDDEYTGGTFAVKGNRVVYHSASGLTCLDSSNGDVLWTDTVAIETEPTKTPKQSTANKRRKPVISPLAFSANIHPTLVLTDDSVFCAVHKTMMAKNLANGKTLWTAPAGENYMKSTEIFFTDGLVWSRDLKGHDPITGKVVRTLTQEMNGPMSHDRCYRNRITHRFYLNSASGGTDFMKLDGKVESPNPWARSTCGLSVMPANGMVYNGPYVCQCAIATMATGVNGFYNGSGNTEERFTVEIEPQLVKGPAFGSVAGAAATIGDWPTYRYSSTRSGITSTSTPETLATRWKVDIGSHPTAPVVAGDSVYVADRDGYTLYSLDRETGVARWSFVADGRIDSPPTYHNGMILVGSRGGWVYGLRASDGHLAWKFNGLPQRRLICDTGRLESAWPVHGSIMLLNDTAYFAAGRSTFLDGGIAVFGLDPMTAAIKHSRVMQGPYQDDVRSFPVQASGQFQLEGCKADIFSFAGDELFMRNQAFKPDLQPIVSESVKTLHLLASPGLLNSSPQHRTYWTVDRDLRYGGAMGTFGAGPAGDTIAFDGKRFYEIRGYAPGRNLPGRGRDLDQLELYSVHSGSYGGMTEKEDKSAIPAMGKWTQRWTTPTPFAGHAIAAAENTVMAAGVPMLDGYSVEDTNASYAGQKGGIAWLLDAKDGHQLQELRFDAAPVWDGIAIAHDSYFMCLKDGSVVCLSATAPRTN
ncbi:outer membrane protein assembly factor BamB family protein [Neorhodopirellula pilleata]|uniref:Outer membrane biogenesis protein BamB n=1 Tax=Neorhodopirellula pilleata TaxID=2714738 RepID=A0A5C5ZV32_9BACT|nr:PQQ-binding-like beta-propeller repeat protein [Neorhodopirellula pilleata]TWT91199.1 outer membrane biogenesis protein BamB [Neorhodopirellula pilleata]